MVVVERGTYSTPILPVHHSSISSPDDRNQTESQVPSFSMQQHRAHHEHFTSVLPVMVLPQDAMSASLASQNFPQLQYVFDAITLFTGVQGRSVMAFFISGHAPLNAAAAGPSTKYYCRGRNNVRTHPCSNARTQTPLPAHTCTAPGSHESGPGAQPWGPQVQLQEESCQFIPRLSM